MGTSSGAGGWPAAALRYLMSLRNLSGAAAGLVGVVVAFAGVFGAYWPLAVAALYTAGALAAPPERVRLGGAGAGRTPRDLRRDLAALAEGVERRRSRLPGAASERFDRLRAKLADLLRLDADLRTDPDTAYELERVVRTDLPEAVEAYLNLPWRFAAGRRADGAGGGSGTDGAAGELCEQLDLLEASVDKAADRLLETRARRQRDHTSYLRARERTAPLDPPGGRGGRRPEDP